MYLKPYRSWPVCLTGTEPAHRVFSPEKTLYTWLPFKGLKLGPSLVNSRMALFLEFMVQQWILFTALAVAIGMFFLHESRRSGASLTPQQAINMLNADEGLFVDLRDSAEYGQGHVVNALNIPLAKLDSRLAELESYRDKPLVLVCKMGQHSGVAGKKLTEKGFNRVYRMRGGMAEWGNMQLPLVR